MTKNAKRVPQLTDPNGDTTMKMLIAASIVLASGIAQAQSFDYEKAVGSSELYSTLGTDQVTSVNTGHGDAFAYQQSVGSHDLFPSLIEGSGGPSSDAGKPFAYTLSVGEEIDA